VVSFVLAAYLGCWAPTRLDHAFPGWNASIPVIEAGLEDALSHLNAHGVTNLNSDGWNQIGNIYWIQRYIGSNYYIVSVSNYTAGFSNVTPVIESRGLRQFPPPRGCC